jgi:hypothetical protein
MDKTLILIDGKPEPDSDEDKLISSLCSAAKLSNLTFASAIKSKTLKLRNLEKVFSNKKTEKDLLKVLNELGGKVEALTIQNSKISDQILGEIIERLPLLKTILIQSCSIAMNSGTINAAEMNNLKELNFYRSSGLAFFNEAKLERFETICDSGKSFELQQKREKEVFRFLQHQVDLKVFDFDFKFKQISLPLRLEKLQFRAGSLILFDNSLATQKENLKEIELFLPKKSFHDVDAILRVLTTISLKLENLQKLHIEFESGTSAAIDEEKIRELKCKVGEMNLMNETLKFLSIHDRIQQFELAAGLIGIFTNAERVELRLYPHNSIKIEKNFDPKVFLKMRVADKLESFNYSPAEIPDDRENFEDLIGNFLKRNNKNLRKVIIGHPNWNADENSFNLSLDFCKNLIANLPQLEEIELFGMARAAKAFNSFLTSSKKKPKVVKLHAEKPTDDGSAPKRMKSEFTF